MDDVTIPAQAFDTLEAITGMGTDADPMSMGRVLNIHFKRPVTAADRQVILDALHAAATPLARPDTAGVEDILDDVLGLLTPSGNVWTDKEPGWQSTAYMKVRDLLAALASPADRTDGAVPPGWKLVPVEPTEAMVNAAVVPLNRTGSVRRVWSAMIAAAPTLPGHKPGWDVDGMCDEHGRFACSKCALPAAPVQS